MTKKVTVINWADPTKSLNFTVHDWLENFLVCDVCCHSNSFYCDYPGDDPLDHVHYFTKLVKYNLKETKRVKEWLNSLASK